MAPDQQTSKLRRALATAGVPLLCCLVLLVRTLLLTFPLSVTPVGICGLVRVHASTSLQARRPSHLSQRICGAFQGQQQIAQLLAASKTAQQHRRRFFIVDLGSAGRQVVRRR